MKRIIDENLIYSYEDGMMKLGLEITSLILRDIFQDPTILKGEMCVIFNDPSFGIPMFATGYPLGIRTSIKEENDYYLLISQLVHELTHYIFRKYKDNKDLIAKRYEEIVAEATSLYALSIAPAYWNTLSSTLDLEDYTPQLLDHFETTIGYYQRNQMPYPQPISKNRWRMLERNCNISRERHFQEVLYLFDAFKNKTIELSLLMNYTPYLNKDGSIDFLKWQKEKPSTTLELASKLQPEMISKNKMNQK